MVLQNLRKWKKWYTVDNVPLFIKPFYLAGSFAVGGLQYLLMHRFVKASSTTTILGSDPRQQNIKCIYAVWHSEVFAFFTAMGEFPDLVCINHPLWYMKPIHVALGLLGTKEIFLGSTGNSGKDAVNNLAKRLQKGDCCSFVNPDGPGTVLLFRHG